MNCNQDMPSLNLWPGRIKRFCLAAREGHEDLVKLLRTTGGSQDSGK